METDVAATVMLRVDMRHLPLIGGDDVLKDNFVEKEARLASTWREFLTRKVGLKLVRDSSCYSFKHNFYKKLVVS